MTTNRQQLGARGEELAVQALRQAGLTILTRNWRCPVGEIDIIAEDMAPDFTTSGEPVPWHVIVEVRTRRGDRFGKARESITLRKQAKLREVAQHYIANTAWRGPWRIDVVAVQMDGRGQLIEIEHIRHAVTG